MSLRTRNHDSAIISESLPALHQVARRRPRSAEGNPALASSVLPRTAARSIRRVRFERWLAENAGVALRFAAAPAGTGKTTAAVEYARAHADRVWYVSVGSDVDVTSMLRRLGVQAGAPAVPSSYDDLLDLLRGREHPLEILIDDVDGASADVLRLLDDLVSDVPVHVELVYLARARRRLELARHLMTGACVVAPGHLFDFDQHEIRALARTHGVEAGDEDVAFLADSTDGWALVVAATMRHAAAHAATLPDAYLAWMETNHQTLRDFTSSVLASAEIFDLDQALSALAAPSPENATLLSGLEERGLFVRRNDDGVRPYRVFGAMRTERPQDALGTVPLVIAMLGRFRATIGGRPIPWLRRREAQIVQYLALKVDGSATREELIEAFWPETSPSLAQQSLRTACSNIRKAFATITGQADVELYFERRSRIELRVDNVVADVRRFREHVIAAEAALRADDHQQAFAHYCAAERLYALPLLSGEPSGPPFDAYAAIFHEAMSVVLERLVELARERTDRELMRTYAERLRRHAEERDASTTRTPASDRLLGELFTIVHRDDRRSA